MVYLMSDLVGKLIVFIRKKYFCPISDVKAGLMGFSNKSKYNSVFNVSVKKNCRVIDSLKNVSYGSEFLWILFIIHNFSVLYENYIREDF